MKSALSPWARDPAPRKGNQMTRHFGSVIPGALIGLLLKSSGLMMLNVRAGAFRVGLVGGGLR